MNEKNVLCLGLIRNKHNSCRSCSLQNIYMYIYFRWLRAITRQVCVNAFSRTSETFFKPNVRTYVFLGLQIIFCSCIIFSSVMFDINSKLFSIKRSFHKPPSNLRNLSDNSCFQIDCYFCFFISSLDLVPECSCAL